jgi:hypothetical protein
MKPPMGVDIPGLIAMAIHHFSRNGGEAFSFIDSEHGVWDATPTEPGWPIPESFTVSNEEIGFSLTVEQGGDEEYEPF